MATTKKILIIIGVGIAEAFVASYVFSWLINFLVAPMEWGGILLLMSFFPMVMYGIISGILLFFKLKHQRKLSSTHAIIGGTIGSLIALMTILLSGEIVRSDIAFINISRFMLFPVFVVMGHVIGLQSKKIKLWALMISIMLMIFISACLHKVVPESDIFLR